MSAFDTFQLGMAILSQLPADDNAVLSPMSLATVMALLFCGSRNSTRSELASILRLSDDAVEKLSVAVRQVMSVGNSDQVRLRCSSAIFTANNYPISSDYVKDVAAKLFAANASSLDISKDPEGARANINAWVAKETADLIKDLLPPGSVSSLTVAVVANAVHFKGLWREPFDSRQTHLGEFHVSDRRIVSTRMMRLTSKFPYGYSEEYELQLLQLPYAGNADFSMLLLLPIEGGELNAALGKLGGDGLALAKLVESMSSMKADVLLPRFSLATTVDVQAVLRALGVQKLFSDDADLTAMCPNGDVYVSSFVHRAVIDVNEEGTEAAAATAAAVNKRSMPIIQRFHCDRPFAFAIWHEPTASAVFFGKVVDPTLAEAGERKPSGGRVEL